MYPKIRVMLLTKKQTWQFRPPSDPASKQTRKLPIQKNYKCKPPFVYSVVRVQGLLPETSVQLCVWIGEREGEGLLTDIRFCQLIDVLKKKKSLAKMKQSSCEILADVSFKVRVNVQHTTETIQVVKPLWVWPKLIRHCKQSTVKTKHVCPSHMLSEITMSLTPPAVCLFFPLSPFAAERFQFLVCPIVPLGFYTDDM